MKLRGTNRRSHLVSAVFAAGLTMALQCGSTSAASDGSDAAQSIEVGKSKDVAGKSPYEGLTCNDFTPDWMVGGGREGEPMIAVNPRAPENRIAAWMDRTRSSIDAAYTLDGGRHWTKSIPSHIDQCSGNFDQEWEATGDVWVTFGPDGTAYFSFLSWAHFETPPLTRYVSVVHVVSSSEGGKTWSAPIGVGRQDWTSDKDMIVADPATPGTVYAAWRNAGFGLPVGDRGNNLLLLSKSTDYGRSWSAPKTVDSLDPSGFFGNPQLVVLGDGTLTYTSTIPTPSGGTDLVAYRSEDKGDTWSHSISIAPLTSGGGAVACGHPINGGYGQTSSTGQTIVHAEIDSAMQGLGKGEIILYWSRDGGLTWQDKPIIDTPDLITQVSATIDKHGRVAVFWDEVDQQNADCAAQPTPIVPSSTHLSISKDLEHWHTVTVGAKSFNLASALVPPNYNVGDYHSLATTPDGFTTVTVQGLPLVEDAPHIVGNTGVLVTDVDVEVGSEH